MQTNIRTSMTVAAAVLAMLAAAYAQGPIGAIEGFYPTQLNPGQTTTFNLAINVGRGGDPIPLQSLEITPPGGITVGAFKGDEVKEGVLWWTMPITVAKDAAPGTRTLVAINQTGRTQPVTLMIADHILAISNLRVTSAPTDGKTIDIQFGVEQQGKPLGEGLMTWFTLSCGRVPETGVVKGRFANGVVTAGIPNPKTVISPVAPNFAPKCTLDVRLTDQANVESNTLTTTVEFK